MMFDCIQQQPLIGTSPKNVNNVLFISYCSVDATEMMKVSFNVIVNFDDINKYEKLLHCEVHFQMVMEIKIMSKFKVSFTTRNPTTKLLVFFPHACNFPDRGTDIFSEKFI